MTLKGQDEKGTLYIYSPSDGKISYTIDNANHSNMSSLDSRGIPYYHGNPGEKIIRTYVVLNSNSVPIGITSIHQMNFLTVDKTSIVANGTDTATISQVADNTLVTIPKEDVEYLIVSPEDSVEISANGFSLDPKENHIDVIFSKYGYDDHTITINITEDV